MPIFLVNGVKLQGIVTWFDNFSVLLRRDAALAARLQARDLHRTPAAPVQLFGAGGGGGRNPGGWTGDDQHPRARSERAVPDAPYNSVGGRDGAVAGRLRTRIW